MQFADKLFVFQRLHGSDLSNGVGLTIVHRIVTKFGGEIWAEGKVKERTVFYFTIN
jgi:signal transduction histidine kinase